MRDGRFYIEAVLPKAMFLLLLFWVSRFNYLLFHSIAEIISIVIAGVIFIIGWNSRKYLNNNFLLFIASPYLFIGLLDLLHTLSYVGMNIFTDYDYYANQLWIATRYMESLTLLAGFYTLNRKYKVDMTKMFYVYMLISFVIIYSVFVSKSFPVCFVGGVGLTPFKKISEYIICCILGLSVYMLYKRRGYFNDRIFRYILISLLCTMVSELAFTFYISNYGLSNLVGHYFKLFSFYFIYKSLIQTGLEEPHLIIFKELNETQARLQESNDTKEILLSIVAHDMKGPVGAMGSFFENMKEDLPDDREYIKMIMAKSADKMHSLHTMLENTLDWSRVHSDKMQVRTEDMDVGELIEESIQHLYHMAEEKNVLIKADVGSGMSLTADREMSKTVLRNVVSNAVKFCPDGGLIVITSGRSEEALCIAVRDNGGGMERDVLENIFNVHYHNKNKNINSGTGLGLALCKALMERQGGRISISSQPGEGTEVIITFRTV